MVSESNAHSQDTPAMKAPISPAPGEKTAATGLVDPKAERRLVRKIDLILMPLLTVTFGLQYYDSRHSFSASPICALSQYPSLQRRF